MARTKNVWQIAYPVWSAKISIARSPVRAVMAARTAVLSGGYNCSFVTKPDNIPTECPECHRILREPFQVTCCGATFCETCIKNVLGDGKACPTCKSPRPQYFIDKRLNGFRVFCHERSVRSACDWTGELDDVDGHLNLAQYP